MGTFDYLLLIVTGVVAAGFLFDGSAGTICVHAPEHQHGALVVYTVAPAKAARLSALEVAAKVS